MLKYLPLSLAPLLLARILVFGASLGDAIAITSLSALYCFSLYIETKRQVPVNKDVFDRLVVVEELVKTTQEKVSGMQYHNLVKR